MLEYSVKLDKVEIFLNYFNEEDIKIGDGAYGTVRTNVEGLVELKNFIDKVLDRISRDKWEKERQQDREAMAKQRTIAEERLNEC